MSDILPGVVVHPPVAHGDLLRLDLVRGDVVVIVDGYYHQSAPVRHKEILALLAEGVVVVGCASMGALRAAELAEYGMIGNGAVYRMYRDGVLDADDEVALAHAPAPDYRSFTVPLVVIRHAVSMAVRSGVLDHIDATSIVTVARAVHYTERSWRAMERAVDATDSIAIAVARLRKFVESDPETTDIKIADVLDTVRKIANGELPAGRHRVGSWVSDDWRNRFLDEWQAEFGIATIDGIDVGHSAIIRYQQLYREDFPARWERFVLGRIAGVEAAEGDLTTLALSRAARSGIGLDSLTDARLRHWLTEQEAAELSAEDALVRVLVRSYQPPCPTRDLSDDEPDLVGDESARRIVAEADVVNAEVASWGGKHTVGHLKLTPLRAHLAEVWRMDAADPVALLAAARDRGFASTDEAIDAARMFFLHKSFMSAAG
ncbi:MAG TPA: TfuA-like protein [Pseudonocardiaceae bacterium]